jgi:hypothetical protein
VLQTSTSPAPTTTVFLASSTSNPSAAASSNSGLSGGAIAGIVIGCIAAVLLLLALGFVFLRRRRSAKTASAGPEMGAAPLAGAEMEGDAGTGAFNDKDAKVLPYAQQAKTDSHTELPGYEAAHEVESPMNWPAEMQGEGYVDSGAAERERGAGPHEMEAGS